MTAHRGAGFAVATAVAVMLGGCSGENAVPEPSPSADRPPSPSPSPPTIDQPRALGDYADFACRLLTGDEVLSLRLDPDTGGANPDAPGRTCEWIATRIEDGSRSVTVAISRETNELPGILRSGGPPGALLERETVADLPAAGIRFGTAARACFLTVGLNDTQSVEIVYEDDDRRTPDLCAAAVEVAELVVAKLPPLNP